MSGILDIAIAVLFLSDTFRCDHYLDVAWGRYCSHLQGMCDIESSPAARESKLPLAWHSTARQLSDFLKILLPKQSPPRGSLSFLYLCKLKDEQPTVSYKL